MHKKILSVVLCLAMLASIFAVSVTTDAATVASEPTGVSKIESADDFSWDNVNMYFLLTDRFYNGNTSNDHAYGRACDANGNPLSGWNTNPGTFHGGDFAGLTKKIEEGYFDKLGVNAIWISAPYEQIHGYVTPGEPNDFAHYSYHGYYVLDYTETDANFGTRAEFKTMVDTAHKHGIRVVMDIVMNHAGYNTIKDMVEFNFGSFKDANAAKSYMYKLTGVNSLHDTVDYTSDAAAWGRWWGTSWIRSGLPGYVEDGGGDLTGCLAGLPDFRTESTNQVSIPEFLKNKWTKEGTYSAKIAKFGASNTVSEYLSSWLADWVEQYGVDGFRCDTAKHVEMASWKKLKTKCVAALKKWRQNNPSAVGADWDEDFWMTGECWGHGMGKSPFFTEGGFDSMINFSITGAVSANPGGMPDVSGLNGMYQNYAGDINNDPNYNLLTYLSSHDTGLVRNNPFWQGTSFLLLPGGIQIFYGDETSRPLVSGVPVGGDGHAVRSDMNFGQNPDLLAHWQKVGKFRANHVAVGAGQHQQITAYNASTGYVFSRTYADDNVTDGVICCIGAPKNTSVSVDVSSMWGNGKTVTNEYDGTTAVVQNGKATFNSGAQGVILISGPQSSISMSIKGNYAFYDKQDVTFKLRGADYAMISVNGGTPFRAVDGQTFSIGEGVEVGTVFEVKATATNSIEPEPVEKTFSFKKKDPNAVTRIYFDNSACKWGTPIKAYIYDESGAAVKENAAWPGQAMTLDNDLGLYVMEVPDDLTNGNVIFIGGSSRYPGEMEKGLSINETDMILIGGKTWEPYNGQHGQPVTPPDPNSTITVYFDNSGSNFANPTIYFWKKGTTESATSWPGEGMSLYKDNVYKYTMSNEFNCCIFSDGGGSKTGDLDIPGKDQIFKGGAWSAYADAEQPTVKPTQAPTQPPVTQPDNPGAPYGDLTTDVLIGDVNQDGIISISDATEIQYYLAAMSELSDAAMAAADTDHDTFVSIKDATMIQYHLAKMSNDKNHCGETIKANTQAATQAATQAPQPVTDPPVQTDPPQPVTEPAPAKNYVYVKSDNWTSVKVYFWSDENKQMMTWPGVDTESLGNGVFRAEVPDGATWVIFNNGSFGNGNQTNDTKLEGYNKILNNGSWSDYTG